MGDVNYNNNNKKTSRESTTFAKSMGVLLPNKLLGIHFPDFLVQLKWCHEVLIGALRPQAPGARMTFQQTPSNYNLVYCNILT